MGRSCAGPRGRWGSALGGVFFGLFLAAAGGLFVWLLGRAALRASAMERWPEVACTILESRLEADAVVPNTPLTYRAVVRYRFEAGGSIRESDRIRRVALKSTDAARIQALVDRFPAGDSAVCYVDPNDPAFSVLERDKKTPLYSIWFPALFVIGGLGIALSSVVRNLKRSPLPI
jgi:Protein of unknown function (DUF3592)